MEMSSLYNIEIPLKEIFNSMKISVSDMFSNGKYYSIPKEYISKRPEIFSLIHKISNKMGFKSQTFFLSIYYLDIIFSTQSTKIDCNYNILALSCLLLSAKYSENDPIVPELKYFIRIYNAIVGNKNYITVSDLFYAEVMTIKMLDYKLNYYSIYDFNSFFFGHCVLKIDQISSITLKQENKKDLLFNNLINKKITNNFIKYRKIYEKIYKKSRHFLDKIINTELTLKYSSLLISIYIMKKSIELTVLSENKLDILDFNSKEKLIKKSNQFFSDILINFYKLDLEKNIEYQQLLEDYEILKIFQKSPKKQEFSSSRPQNFNKQQSSEINLQIPPLSPNKLEIQQNRSNVKSLNQRLNEINSAIFVSRLNKKSSNSIKNKNDLTKFSQRVISTNQIKELKNEISKSKTIKDEKVIKKIIKKYKENYYSDSENSVPKNSNINALKFLYRVNTQEYYKSNYNTIKSKEISLSPNNKEKTKNICICTSNKDLNILKVNKISESENNNYNSENNFSNYKPYYKKVVRNCGNSQRKFNVLSNVKLSEEKLNLGNDSNLQSNKVMENVNLIGGIRKKIAFNDLSEEKNFKINNDLKYKVNMSDNENEKMPRNTLHVTKKLNIKKNLKNNVKKIYSNNNNSKIVSQLTNSIEDKNINNIDNNNESSVQSSFMLSNKQLTVNLKNINIKKNNNIINNINKFKKMNTMSNLNNNIQTDANENNFISNTFASIHQKNGFDILNMSTKTNKLDGKRNFSDYQCSTEEKNIETDFYNSVKNDAKSIRNLVGTLFKNQLLNKSKKYKNEEERLSQGTYNSTRYSYNSTNKNKNISYRDKEKIFNNKINVGGSGMKINRQSIGNNLLKRIQSTIVINNNININIGNKGNNYRKKYKNIKSSSIQVNNGNGSNSINSLLNKIPLVYKNSDKK